MLVGDTDDTGHHRAVSSWDFGQKMGQQGTAGRWGKSAPTTGVSGQPERSPAHSRQLLDIYGLDQCSACEKGLPSDLCKTANPRLLHWPALPLAPHSFFPIAFLTSPHMLAAVFLLALSMWKCTLHEGRDMVSFSDESRTSRTVPGT